MLFSFCSLLFIDCYQSASIVLLRYPSSRIRNHTRFHCLQDWWMVCNQSIIYRLRWTILLFASWGCSGLSLFFIWNHQSANLELLRYPSSRLRHCTRFDCSPAIDKLLIPPSRPRNRAKFADESNKSCCSVTILVVHLLYRTEKGRPTYRKGPHCASSA